MTMRVRCAMILAAVFRVGFAAQNAVHFPEWKPVPLGWEDLWQTSPSIVIGDLVNVRTLGDQSVHNLPWPAESVRWIFWCEGKIIVHSIIRGAALSPEKKFIWGSGFPGCELQSFNKAAAGGETITQLWFVREEKDQIRPLSDMVLRYVFHGRWDIEPRLDPQIRFSMLLLSPSANGASPEDYAARLPAMAGAACSLLSKVECTKQIRHLAMLGDPNLRAA